MPNVRESTSRLFALPEYERAQFDVFFSAVKGLMKAKDSFYAQIPEGDSSEMLPATQNTMPSGQTVKSEPLLIENKVVFKWDDVRRCNLDALAEQADKASEERLAVIVPHLFALIGRMSEAAGTS